MKISKFAKTGVFGLLIGTTALLSVAPANAASIRSNDKYDFREIRSTELGDGHVRFEFCPNNESSNRCRTLGDARGYTKDQLARKAKWVKANAVTTAAVDAVGAAAAFYWLSEKLGLGFFEYSIERAAGSTLASLVGGPYALSKSGIDVFNPFIKTNASKVLKQSAADPKKDMQLSGTFFSGSIEDLAARIDKSLRGLSYEPGAKNARVASAKVKNVPAAAASSASSGASQSRASSANL